MKKRIKYLIGFIIILIVEVFIALYVHDNVIRPYVGDILVIICIYLLLRIIIPEKIKYLSLYVLILAILVEIMQYFNFTDMLSAQNKILKIALGSTFDINDIVCYVIGYIIIILFEQFERRKLKWKLWEKME